MSSSAISSILIIAAISTTIGFIVGWLVAALRGEKQPPKEISKSPRSTPTRPNPSVPAPAGPPAFLRLQRNTREDGLEVNIRGQRVESAQNLTPADRWELIALIKETGKWLGVTGQISSSTSTAVANPQAQHLAEQPRPSPAQLPQVQLTESPIETMSGAPPSLIGSMTNVLADALGPSRTSIRPAPKSIVQQIDDILQAKLLGTVFEGQKIHLSEDPTRGVLVHIGAKVYVGVGSVPEGDVKNILLSSVRDWERMQELGTRK
jgi:hypothetical protein